MATTKENRHEFTELPNLDRLGGKEEVLLYKTNDFGANELYKTNIGKVSLLQRRYNLISVNNIDKNEFDSVEDALEKWSDINGVIAFENVGGQPIILEIKNKEILQPYINEKISVDYKILFGENFFYWTGVEWRKQGFFYKGFIKKTSEDSLVTYICYYQDEIPFDTESLFAVARITYNEENELVEHDVWADGNKLFDNKIDDVENLEYKRIV